MEKLMSLTIDNGHLMKSFGEILFKKKETTTTTYSTVDVAIKSNLNEKPF